MTIDKPFSGDQERLAEVNEVAISLRVESPEEAVFVATSPDLPGLVAEGRSVTEAVEIAQALGRKIVESCLEHGDPLPSTLAHLSEALLKSREEHRSDLSSGLE
jgi:predicted RNase H-like HicB family nuclease